MHAKHRTLVRGILVAGALLGFAGATPALAEGSWTSHISNWGPGSESRRWTDYDRDDAVTTVSFKGCTTDTNEFKNADLQLYKDVVGPDRAYGYRLNRCDTSVWGDQSSGEYYFALEGVRAGGKLWVDSVSTQY
ncbi:MULTISPECIES: hypothetical protein [unclassified Kitasatospora]|uniref:hypothetical protein n=1 Tax=unclassified Kitasatospora TaxID=2633591 RepID=UPI002E34FEFE|nr:hypothetical protein [Kitasatospora sp. NBC_01246]